MDGVAIRTTLGGAGMVMVAVDDELFALIETGLSYESMADGERGCSAKQLKH